MPLWKDSGGDYNKRVEEMIKEVSPSSATKNAMKVERPVLVSMTHIDANSYEVVSIREREISSGGATFDLVSAEGSAILLSHGNLVRLSLSRELRSPADIESVKVAIGDWAKRL